LLPKKKCQRACFFNETTLNIARFFLLSTQEFKKKQKKQIKKRLDSAPAMAISCNRRLSDSPAKKQLIKISLLKNS
jgi:hypothetical protein